MIMKGKIICQYLKGVRRKIAEANGIELDIPECTFQGECRGTCPRCESEIKYLEDKLKERGALAKKIAVIGVAAGMAVTTAPNAAAQVDSDTIHRCKTDSVQVLPELVLPESNDRIIDGITDAVVLGWVEPWWYKVIDSETKVVAKPFHGTLSTLPEDDTNRELTSMPPEFPGGEDSLQQYIKDHVVYPDDAKNQKIEGTVILQVHISETGKVTNVKVKTKVHPQLDAEAVRLVRSLPDWIPATLEGSAIKTKRLLYVTFSLK